MALQLARLLIVTGLSNRLSGCSPEAVKVTFLINLSSMTADQRNQSEHITRTVASSLYEGSEIDINELSYTVTNIASSSTSSKDSSWLAEIQFGEVKVMRTNNIYSSIIDRELNSIFTVSQYKEEAEFVVLLVSDKTVLDAVSALLKKKKTFVVVLGSSVPKIFKAVASRDDYMFQVKSLEDPVKVADKIKELIACDSDQYCDTDSYSLNKGSRCKSCEGLCSQKKSTCAIRCPFYMQAESNPEDNVHGKKENVRTATKVEENKYLVIWLIIGTITLVVLGIVAVLKMCHLCKIREDALLTPSSSDETFIKESDLYTITTDKNPIQESTENDILLGDQHAANGAAPEEASGTEIPVTLKNGDEFTLNVDANKEEYRALH